MYMPQIISLTALAMVVLAAPASRCKPVPSPSPSPTTPTYTLPDTGSTNLPAPSTNLTLKYLAVGHGIQNYTCASANASAVNVGALAVLYDATPLYPGTASTGMDSDAFNNISSSVLWSQAIPLNLVNPAAGAVNAAVSSSEVDYQASTTNPFPSPAADLSAGGVTAKFLGHHYFDSQSSPTFDLSGVTGGLLLSAAKIGDVKAPSTADKGLLATGAVDWLELGDNGRGISNGLSNVYRVVTAGGVAEACSISGVNPTGQVFSVPYVAEYWFYG